MSILYDASCGMGTLATTYPKPLVISANSTNSIDNTNNTPNSSNNNIDVLCGYAGGIGPNTIQSVCDSLLTVTDGKRIWIDMESSLRTLQCNKIGEDPIDVFDIHKCFLCTQIVIKYGLPVSKISLMSV